MTSELEKVSLKQVRALSLIMSRLSLLQTDYIKKRYSEIALNFDDTTRFLSDLNLIKLTKKQIRPKTEYKTLLKKIRNSDKSEQLINEFLVNHFINSRNHFSEYLEQFLVHFVFNNGRHEYSPTMEDRLKYSGLRNLLIELELIYLDTQKDIYVIDSNYLLNYFQVKKPRLVSQEEYVQIQHERADIGNRAELKVIEYEKQRLSQYPMLSAQVEHIGLNNITVGYDIKSYDHTPDGNIVPRLIEVKAVSHWNYGFYWTRNEIEASRVHRHDYYLYLLPVLAGKDFDEKNLKIICDPFMNVYKNKNEWSRKNETISFSLRNYRK